MYDGEIRRARSRGGGGLELVGGAAREGGGEAAGGGVLYPGHWRHCGQVQELEGEDAACGAALWWDFLCTNIIYFIRFHDKTESDETEY